MEEGRERGIQAGEREIKRERESEKRKTGKEKKGEQSRAEQIRIMVSI